MAVEKKWLAVPASSFTADGTKFGVVTIADTNGYKVKGDAAIVANTLPPMQVQIQRVISATQMIVGRPGTTPQPNHFVDISAYTVALGSQIIFPEQDKNKIKPDDIEQATYEADPTVAVRVIPVDPLGNLIGPDNPLSVSIEGTISIGEVEIKGSPTGDLLNVNADGSINVNTINPALVPFNFGDVQVTYDSNGNPTRYNFYLATVLQGYIIVSYDSNSNPTNYQGYTAGGTPL